MRNTNKNTRTQESTKSDQSTRSDICHLPNALTISAAILRTPPLKPLASLCQVTAPVSVTASRTVGSASPLHFAGGRLFPPPATGQRLARKIAHSAIAAHLPTRCGHARASRGASEHHLATTSLTTASTASAARAPRARTRVS